MNNMTRRGGRHFLFENEADDRPLTLTDDDKHILFEVYRHGLLDTQLIGDLLPHRSNDWYAKRLRRLTKAGYLSRPAEQTALRRPGGGSYPMIYAMGNRGAHVLREEHKLPIRTNRWNSSGGKHSAGFLEHSIAASRFVVKFRASVEKRGEAYGFEYPDDVFMRLKPDLLTRKRVPMVLRTKVHWHNWPHEEGTAPDAFCAIHYKHRNERSRRYFFVELDRASMTIEPTKKNLTGRNFWKQSSVLRKFVVYDSAYQTKAHEKHFGISTFHVLTVTTSPGHAQTMVAALNRHLPKAAPIRFLFTDFETLAAHNFDVLKTPILNSKGEVFSLL